MKANLIFLLVIFSFCTACMQESKSENISTPPGKSAELKVDPKQNLGVGPIKKVELGEIDQDRAEKGKGTFDTMCIICHQLEGKLIGPELKGIISRRSPEWIMNIILNTEEMLKRDPIAKELLKEYNNIPMLNQSLSEVQARNVLEYFRTLE